MKSNETSTTTRREAFKAFIGEQIISYISTNSRKINKDMATLHSKIKLLEQKLDQNLGDSAEIQQKLLLYRTNYNKMSANHAA